jgi:hypothetical protein
MSSTSLQQEVQELSQTQYSEEQLQQQNAEIQRLRMMVRGNVRIPSLEVLDRLEQAALCMEARYLENPSENRFLLDLFELRAYLFREMRRLMTESDPAVKNLQAQMGDMEID